MIALKNACEENGKCQTLNFQLKVLMENQKTSVVPLDFLISCSHGADMAENQAKA